MVLALDYPNDWIESAIPYGVLKKCIKRVHQELEELGLEPGTLRQLLTAQTTSSQGAAVPLARYHLDGRPSGNIQAVRKITRANSGISEGNTSATSPYGARGSSRRRRC